MRRVQSGDEAAFAQLLETWELPVKRLLARFVQNTAEAEDLAQEAFVRVWQQRDRFRPDGEFRPWLFAIAVNLARNRLRWWRRRPAVSLDAWTDHAPVELADAALNQAAAVERREQIEAVRAAIAGLPANLREAVILFEYEELSHAEISAALGCSAKAVETRLYRARELLRTGLMRPR